MARVSRRRSEALRLIAGAKAGSFLGFVDACLAALSSSAPTGGEWLHEIKYDGSPYSGIVTISQVLPCRICAQEITFPSDDLLFVNLTGRRLVKLAGQADVRSARRSPSPPARGIRAKRVAPTTFALTANHTRRSLDRFTHSNRGRYEQCLC